MSSTYLSPLRKTFLVRFVLTVLCFTIITVSVVSAFVPQNAYAAAGDATDIINSTSDDFTDCDITCVPKRIILAIIGVFSFVASFGVSLIYIATDPTTLETMFNLPSLYTVWGIVRDLFNVTFIFILLFSAFATIFRVQQFHLKNVLVKVLIVALLINFSWPVTRIFIDLSNLLMYFFLGDATSFSLIGQLGSKSEIANLVIKNGSTLSNETYTRLFMMAVFMFIFALTIVTIGFQLFVRVIALMLLLIFSPIGIAGLAVPRLESSAKKWWDKLLAYAFTGPIAIFMVIFAVNTMNIINPSGDQVSPMQEASMFAGSKVSSWKEWIGDAIIFTIPIVILWGGVIITRRLSDAGSSFVSSNVSRQFMRAPNYIRKRAAKTTANAVKTRATGAVQLADRALGYRVSDFANKRGNAVKARDTAYKDQSKAGHKRLAERRDVSAEVKKEMGSTAYYLSGIGVGSKKVKAERSALTDRKIVESREEEQRVKALAASFEQAGVDPNDIQLIASGESPADKKSRAKLYRSLASNNQEIIIASALKEKTDAQNELALEMAKKAKDRDVEMVKYYTELIRTSNDTIENVNAEIAANNSVSDLTSPRVRKAAQYSIENKSKADAHKRFMENAAKQIDTAGGELPKSPPTS